MIGGGVDAAPGLFAVGIALDGGLMVFTITGGASFGAAGAEAWLLGTVRMLVAELPAGVREFSRGGSWVIGGTAGCDAGPSFLPALYPDTL